jgi:hypothetical protein
MRRKTFMRSKKVLTFQGNYDMIQRLTFNFVNARVFLLSAQKPYTLLESLVGLTALYLRPRATESKVSQLTLIRDFLFPPKGRVEPMIKAIETVYNGYRFRSRLEARWAVFFDSLGIEYQYEAEGFDIDGVWYLPDFWLPELKCWCETKAKLPDDLDSQVIKWGELSKQNPLLIITGQPYPNEYTVTFVQDDEVVGSGQFWPAVTKGKFVLVLHNPHYETLNYIQLATFDSRPQILEALTAARQARFA